MDEVEAIRRCQAGERDAFRFIVDQYAKVLHGTAYMMTRDKSLAEDLVQETLLAALRARKQFQGQSSGRTWFVAILRRKIVDHIRKAIPAAW